MFHTNETINIFVTCDLEEYLSVGGSGVLCKVLHFFKYPSCE